METFIGGRIEPLESAGEEKFADGAAYWYWSSEYDETNLTDCCSRTLYFVKGVLNTRRFSYCQCGGVRAVRNIR